MVHSTQSSPPSGGTNHHPFLHSTALACCSHRQPITANQWQRHCLFSTSIVAVRINSHAYATDRGRYAASLLSLYAVVTSYSYPNFRGARVTIPTNLHLKEWANICHAEEGAITLSCLTLVFPVGYEGPIPTLSQENHSSAINHSRDVAACIATELGEGAMLGAFDRPAFHPWTQMNPLLTRPKKDSHFRQVIMELSRHLPPGSSVNGCTPRDWFTGEPQKMHLTSAGDCCTSRMKVFLVCN